MADEFGLGSSQPGAADEFGLQNPQTGSADEFGLGGGKPRVTDEFGLHGGEPGAAADFDLRSSPLPAAADALGLEAASQAGGPMCHLERSESDAFAGVGEALCGKEVCQKLSVTKQNAQLGGMPIRQSALKQRACRGLA